ncbi:MAG: ABC transporter permease subunit [Acidothermus cellulolyticus]|nr:ABC transporter permease subunit [Acidothermus cellulolyticus]
MMDKHRDLFVKWAWQGGLIIAVLLAWQFLPPALGISKVTLPQFSDVIEWAFKPPLPGAGSLGANIVVTLREIAVAFVVAAVAGIVVGTIIGSSRMANALIQPLLTAAFAVPLITLIPMFLVTFGLGETSKMAFGALYAFFPVVFNTAAGVASVDDLHRQVGRAFGLSPWARFYKIIMPGAARQIFGGLQMGMAITIIAVVSAEVFGATAGLGYLIQRSSQALNGPAVWWVILVTLAMSWALLALLKLVARLLRVRPESSMV